MKTMLRGDLRGLLTNSVFVLSAVLIPISVSAQDTVIIDMGALDAAPPRLLVPEDQGTPVTLRPPPGMQSTTSDDNAIKLRPPPSMVKLNTPASAPKTTVAQKPAQPATPKKAEVADAAPPAASAPQAAPPAAAQPKEANVAVAAPVPAPNTPRAAVSAPPKPTQITPRVDPAVVAKASVGDAPEAKPAATESTADVIDPPAAEETQTAALVAPAETPSPPDEFTISYGVGNSDVPDSANDDLRLLAARMVKNTDLRVEFIAFASDAEDSVSRSRRLSLERAVNVRKMLLDSGVDSSRVNLRALGEQSGDGAPDRIDVIVTTR